MTARPETLNPPQTAAGQSLAPARGSLPRGPWLAANQYGMRFILSQDNEVIWRADWLPFETLRAMVKAANEQMAANDKGEAPPPCSASSES